MKRDLNQLAELTATIASKTINKVRHGQTSIDIAGVTSRIYSDFRDETILRVLSKAIGHVDELIALDGTPLEHGELDSELRMDRYAEGCSDVLSETIRTTLGPVLTNVEDLIEIVNRRAGDSCFTRTINIDDYFSIKFAEHSPVLNCPLVKDALVVKEGRGFYEHEVDNALFVPKVDEETLFLSLFDHGDSEVLENIAVMIRTLDLELEDVISILRHHNCSQSTVQGSHIENLFRNNAITGYEEALLCLCYYITMSTKEQDNYFYLDKIGYWGSVMRELIMTFDNLEASGFLFNPVALPSAAMDKRYDFTENTHIRIPVFWNNLKKLYETDKASGLESIYGLLISNLDLSHFKISDTDHVDLTLKAQEWLSYRDAFGEKEKSNLDWLVLELFKNSWTEYCKEESSGEVLETVTQIVLDGVEESLTTAQVCTKLVAGLAFDSPISVDIISRLPYTEASGFEINGSALREFIIDATVSFCAGMVRGKDNDY